jgi:anti-anti-sigma regulatory factor
MPPPSPPLQLANRMTIAQSADLHRALTASLASGAPLLIDGGCVEQIDTAVLQLLVSAFSSATQRGIERRWLDASPALRRSAMLIGVAQVLDLDGAGPLA